MPFSAPFFTDGQLVEVIRFTGYPSYSFFGWVFEEDYATLTLRLQNMSADEAAIITGNYLVVLPTLEKAITDASCNLATDAAGPWKHNRNEISDRTNLFDQKRRELCAFIGVRPGRGLRQAGMVIRT